MKYDVAVIGGGASGLACAVRLLRKSRKIKLALIDANERLGKKLASTGNGQGNVTNLNMSPDKYFSSNINTVKDIALSSNGIAPEKELFHCILQSDEKGRVYPSGRQASALVDSLLSGIGGGNVDVFKGIKVTEIETGFKITLSDGQKIFSDYVVVATGGKAQKQFKTDGSSYGLVKKFGHETTPLFPSLVQLKTDTQYTKSLKGIRINCIVTALCKNQEIATAAGDVIFTDYGVSGNAVFSVSPYVADKQNAVLSLCLLDEADENIIADIRNKKNLGYPKSELLSGTLHNQIGRAVINRCQSDDEKVICNTLKNFTLKVFGTLGFDYAQVTKGGIEMSGVTDELESKFKKNLFFAGEILDVDGCCGGYNLHWAFSSAFAVADAIIKRQ